MTTTNAITWFEIGTDRPEEAERFYGELFGWVFAEQGAPGRSYRVTDGGAGDEGIGGAIRASDGSTPNYAIFYAQVADVADAVRRAETAGGSVLVPPVVAPSGLTFAHLVDPSGNHFGVFTPPAGR
ncbi:MULTISPECIES: VOC family protein [unclassified Micromonospora]|uniref:VOC family protein n=1 Tax=unclassified Micromonospora TaxID=2617518 RepID=UPI0036446B96